jgi:hypothetical protein
MTSLAPTRFELINLYEDMEYNFQEFADYVDAYCNKYLDENEKKIVDEIINKTIKNVVFESINEFSFYYDKNLNLVSEDMVNEDMVNEDMVNEDMVNEDMVNEEQDDYDEFDDLEECVMTIGRLQKVVAQIKTTVEVVE